MRSLISIGLHDLDFSAVIDAEIKKQNDKKAADQKEQCCEKEQKCCNGQCCP